MIALSALVDWHEAAMPGATGPVRLVTVPWSQQTGGLVGLVRFLPGWSRPISGHYPAEEEIVVLDGTLELNATSYPAGTYLLVRPEESRWQTATPDGALAFVRFSAPPRWVEVAAGDLVAAADFPTRRLAAAAGPVGPLGVDLGAGPVPGELARTSDDGVVELLAGLHGGLADRAAEVLVLASRLAGWFPVGSELPDIVGPLIVRWGRQPSDDVADRHAFGTRR